MRVIILEDEKSFAEQAIDVVRGLGGDPAWMTSSSAALEDILEADPPYQALILDRVLDDEPGSDSLWLLPELRRNAHTLPVIVTSALDRQDQQWDGFNAGAIDYLPKPYASEDLAIRLRRATNLSRFQRGRLEIDLRRQEGLWGGNRLNLPPKCFEILALLAQNVGEPVPKSAIYKVGWPRQRAISRDRVDAAIRRLRAELARFDAQQIIRVVDRVGYMLDPDLL